MGVQRGRLLNLLKAAVIARLFEDVENGRVVKTASGVSGPQRRFDSVQQNRAGREHLLPAVVQAGSRRGDEERLRTGAARLAGLGEGLTPAGDDFLSGVMLCAWLAHPDPAQYCRMILDACSPRTTVLSWAFLRSAAVGECSAPWHRLLNTMPDGSVDQLGHAAREILSVGHTSGADALAGFLWIGLRILKE